MEWPRHEDRPLRGAGGDGSDSDGGRRALGKACRTRRAFEDRSGRETWFLDQRALPARPYPRGSWPRLSSEAAECRVPEDASPAWESLGPAPIRNVTMQGSGDMTYSGRALAVALDPRDSRTIFVGAAQGGIWRSEDGGAHFSAVADGMPSLAIKVIRFAPSNPDVVYAGSGEPHSKTSLFGMGVFRSTDGGRNWQALPPSGSGWDFRYLAVSGLQVDPTDASILYVTTANVLPDRVDPFHPPPWAAEPGIFKSTDGGQSWVRKLTAKITGLMTTRPTTPTSHRGTGSWTWNSTARVPVSSSPWSGRAASTGPRTVGSTGPS